MTRVIETRSTDVELALARFVFDARVATCAAVALAAAVIGSRGS